MSASDGIPTQFYNPAEGFHVDVRSTNSDFVLQPRVKAQPISRGKRYKISAEEDMKIMKLASSGLSFSVISKVLADSGHHLRYPKQIRDRVRFISERSSIVHDRGDSDKHHPKRDVCDPMEGRANSQNVFSGLSDGHGCIVQPKSGMQASLDLKSNKLKKTGRSIYPIPVFGNKERNDCIFSPPSYPEYDGFSSFNETQISIYGSDALNFDLPVEDSHVYEGWD